MDNSGVTVARLIPKGRARLVYETPKLTRVSNLFDLVGRGSGSTDAQTSGKKV